MKRVLAIILAVTMLLACALSFSACTTLKKLDDGTYDKGAFIDLYIGDELYDFDPQLSYTDYNMVQLFSLLYEGLTTIGDGAFACCLALTDITLPDSLTTIGEGAFGCRIDIASAGDGFGYKTITVHAPHDADFYRYDPDDGVNWVIDK